MPLRCLYEAYHHQRQPSIPQPWLARLVRGTPHLRCAALSHLCTCLTLSNQAARLLRKHHKRQRLSGAGESSPECSSELPQVGCSAQHSTAQHSTAQHSSAQAGTLMPATCLSTAQAISSVTVHSGKPYKPATSYIGRTAALSNKLLLPSQCLFSMKCCC